MTRPSLADVEKDRERAARTGKCVDDAVLASHVPALSAALCDVLALHREGRGFCRDCDHAYPCPTVRALATHLDLTDPEGDPT